MLILSLNIYVQFLNWQWKAYVGGSTVIEKWFTAANTLLLSNGGSWNACVGKRNMLLVKCSIKWHCFTTTLRLKMKVMKGKLLKSHILFWRVCVSGYTVICRTISSIKPVNNSENRGRDCSVNVTSLAEREVPLAGVLNIGPQVAQHRNRNPCTVYICASTCSWMLIRVTGQERQLPRCLCEKWLFCQLAVAADNQSE